MSDDLSKQEIARRLKVTRLALSFEKQVDFARALGDRVTAQRWNNYKSGRDRLTLNLALTICRKFPQVTLDWIFRGDKGTLRPAFSTALDETEEFLERLRS